MIPMYQICVPPALRALTNLADVLSKGERHCTHNKIDPAVMLQSRLFPDMLPLVRQVQIAGDMARRLGGRMAGQDVPSIADTEATFGELDQRLKVSIAFLRSLDAKQFEGSESRDIVIPNRQGDIHLPGLAYAQDFALPNIYFHVTTAYNILRHNGVVIGKQDFVGALTA
jgi:hypothetical protein